MPKRPGGYSVSSVGQRGFAHLADAWRSLEAGSDLTAFQRFDWMALVNEHAARERASRFSVRTRYYLVERAGVPVLIAPLRAHLTSLSPGHRRGIHLSGRHGPADYLNLVYADFDPVAVSKALTAAVRDFGVSTFRWERMLIGTSAYRWASGLPGAWSDERGAVSLQLPSSGNQYASLLTKGTRQNIRTAWNRARTDGVHLEVTVSSDLSHDEACELADLKRRREYSRRARDASGAGKIVAGLRGAYFAGLFAPHDEALEAMTRTAHPWVLRVLADGQVCAFAFGLGDTFGGRRTLRLLQVGIDERFSRYSPGLLGLHHFIVSEASAGCPNWDVVDFTRGEEPYKFQLGGKAHAYADIAFRWEPPEW